MKYLLILALLFAIAVEAQTITPDQAKDSIGKKATVCGMVTSAKSTDKATFLNFGGEYPNHVFTAVVFAADLPKFTDLVSLKGKNVCITGQITPYKNKPQIVMTAAPQLKVQ